VRLEDKAAESAPTDDVEKGRSLVTEAEAASPARM
jgi:hypothetical protein